MPKAVRYNIRSPGFMDREPDPRQVPEEIVAHIEANLEILRQAWDARHPENPVQSGDGSP